MQAFPRRTVESVAEGRVAGRWIGEGRKKGGGGGGGRRGREGRLARKAGKVLSRLGEEYKGPNDGHSSR